MDSEAETAHAFSLFARDVRLADAPRHVLQETITTQVQVYAGENGRTRQEILRR
jgi:hypothetical protein